MLVTAEFLKEKEACTDGYRYVSEKGWLGLETVPFLRNLMTDKKYDWANWLIVRCMVKKQYLAYAIYAAEQVIEIYEKQYPKDDRPRKAIEAAKKYLEKPTDKNKDAAAHAADAADAAAYAADAADAARAAYAAAREQMQIKILEYGIGLLEP